MTLTTTTTQCDSQPKRGDRDGDDDDRRGRRDGNGRSKMSGKKSWSKNSEKKDQRDDRGHREKHDRRDNAYLIDNRRSSSNTESPTDDRKTDVNEDGQSVSTASGDVDKDNFAAALRQSAKMAKKVKRGSAVTKKEVAPARKRKPAEPTERTGMTMTMRVTKILWCRARKLCYATPSMSTDGSHQQ